MFSMKHKSTYKRFPTNIGSKEINMLIDSGSLLLDILDENIQNFRPCTNIEKSNTKTFSYHSNTSSEALGAFKAYTTVFDKTFICKFYVVKGYGRNLLGKESANQFNLLRVGPPEKAIYTISYNKQSKEDIKEHINHPALQIVLDKHKDVFQEMGKLKNYQLKLHVDESVIPIQQPVRRFLYHTREKVSKEITRLLENDYIERAEGRTSWINPVVGVSKSNGAITISLDIRRANESLIRQRETPNTKSWGNITWT